MERVWGEKSRFIKKDKIKSRIYCRDGKWFESVGNIECEIEVPFEIPESWAYCRFSDIVDFRLGKTPERKSDIYWKNGTIPWMSIADMVPNGVTKVTKEKISQQAFNDCFTSICEKGTLIMSFKLTIGKITIADMDCVHNEAMISIYPFSDEPIFKKWLFVMLPLLTKYVKSEKAIKGSTLNKKTLSSMLVCIPPLEEQKRIISKLEELTALVDKYGRYEAQLSELNSSLAPSIRKSVLQYAIQGKLVPQDPADEPASILLEKWGAEKARLVTKGKIKKDKHESIIYRKNGVWFEHSGNIDVELDIPFDIPDTWMWVRGYTIFAPNESTEPQGETFRYIDLDAIDNVNCSIREVKTIPVKGATSRARRKIHEGDVLYSTVRPYLRNIAIVHKEHESAIASTGFFVCNTRGLMLTEFLYFQLQSPYVTDGLNEYTKSERSPSITQEDFLGYLFLLPPLAEQKRIVAKLNELKALTGALTQ